MVWTIVKWWVVMVIVDENLTAKSCKASNVLHIIGVCNLKTPAACRDDVRCIWWWWWKTTKWNSSVISFEKKIIQVKLLNNSITRCNLILSSNNANQLPIKQLQSPAVSRGKNKLNKCRQIKQKLNIIICLIKEQKITGIVERKMWNLMPFQTVDFSLKKTKINKNKNRPCSKIMSTLRKWVRICQ